VEFFPNLLVPLQVFIISLFLAALCKKKIHVYILYVYKYICICTSIHTRTECS
jgi:hypothetical protein